MCQCCYDHETDPPNNRLRAILAVAAIAICVMAAGIAFRPRQESKPPPSFAARAAHWTVKRVNNVRKLPVVQAIIQQRA